MTNFSSTQSTFLSFGAVLVSAQLLVSAPALARKEGPTLVIRSNVKTIVISRDGVILGSENSPLSLAEGENVIEVSAKDYVTRVIHVTMTSATDKRQIQLGLVKSPPTARSSSLVWDLPKNEAGPQKIKERPSICKGRPPTADFTCPRATVDDDILFSGVMWQNLQPPAQMDKVLADQLATKTFAELAADDAFLQGMDTLRLTLPGDEQLHAIMGRLFMWRGNCGRVDELLTENQRCGMPQVDLKILSALCYERTGRPEIGLALLEKHFDAFPPTPQLYYHRIRRLLPDYIADAQKLTAACVKDFPNYYPCYELWSLANNLKSRSSVVVRHTYLKKSQDLQRSALLGVVRLKRAGKPREAYAEAQRQMLAYHLQYELAWYAVILQKALNIPVNVGLMKEKSHYLRILDRALATEIAGDLATQEKGEMLQLAYRTFVREYPAEMSYWMNLVRLHDAAGECPTVVSLTRESYPFLRERDRYKMSLWEGQCLVKMQRFDEALKVYQKLTSENNLIWSGFYNLGAVYERLGDGKHALAAFKTATEKRPPATALSKLLDKIAYYEKHNLNPRGEDEDDGGSAAIEVTTQSGP